MGGLFLNRIHGVVLLREVIGELYQSYRWLAETS